MAGLRFLFTSNALSKSMFCNGFLKLLSRGGRRAKKASTERLARYFDIDPSQVYLFGAGRMSVYLTLKAMNIKEEDEVVVAGYTCVVLTNAVKFAGCTVRYVDIAPGDVNPNEEQVLATITPKTKMLILPHNFGIPFEGIARIKAKHPEIVIMEDAAHTLGSKTSEGHLCGTLGDAAFFSLEYSKPLTTGLGGILLVNNSALQVKVQQHYQELPEWKGKEVFRMVMTLMVYNLSYFRSTSFFNRNALRALRLFGWQYGTSQKEIEGEKPDNYPVKMSGTQACFLPGQLKRIEEINEVKRQVAQDYQQAFSGFSSIQKIEGLDRLVLVRYPLLFDDSVSTDTIQELKQEGLRQGFNFGVWFNDVVHPQGSFRYCYDTGDCPNGEQLSGRILNLPVNANYPPTLDDLKALADLFRKFEID